MSLSFTKKCIKSDNNADSFSEIDKMVNTRLHEKYYVTPARTERFAKSTISYLQRMLNEEKME